MENYWSELVWQAGGDIVSEDRTQTLLGSDEAVGGLQFLQDLIYTHKIMPTPDVFAEVGDAFEQGSAAMESNGSWLVPTHLAAGIDFGIAPLPAGPAGQATSINPTGVVVSAEHRQPGRRVGVREVAGRAGGAGAADGSSRPRCRWTSASSRAATRPPSRAPTCSPRSLEHAHLKPSFAGYTEWTTALQEELDDEGVQRAEQDRA